MEKEYIVCATEDYDHYFNSQAVLYDTPRYVDKRADRNVLNIRSVLGTKIRLSEIPAFVERFGDCIISKDSIEIYNDYRE